MDGRWIRKLWLTSCLIPGALGCRHTERTPFDVPISTSESGMPSLSAKRPIWEKSATQSVPIEAVVETTKKGPPSPSSLVAIADLRLEGALDEKNPPENRQKILDLARQGYQQALQQDPKNKAALLGLAKYYTRLGEREKAVEVYKKYLTLYPGDKAVAHQVAVAHAQWKDWPGAISWCEFTLKLDPEGLNTRKMMAFCYARSGMVDKGLEVMLQVMSEPQARYLMARLLEHQNDFAGSRSQLELALKVDPNYQEARDFLVELDQVTSGAVPDPSALRQASFTEPQQPQQFQQLQQPQP